jgi:hypothetical protein
MNASKKDAAGQEPAAERETANSQIQIQPQYITNKRSRQPFFPYGVHERSVIELRI